MLALWIGIVDLVVVALIWVQVARTLARHPGRRVSVRRPQWGRLVEGSERSFWSTRTALVVLGPVLGVMCSHLPWVDGVLDLVGVFVVVAVVVRVVRAQPGRRPAVTEVSPLA